MDLIRTAEDLVDRALLILGVTAARPPDNPSTVTSTAVADRALVKLGVSVVRPSVTGTTHTTSDLITHTFKRLMVIGDGDTATAEEQANLTALITPIVTSLSQRGIVNISNINAISSQYFDSLTDILAWAYAADRGKAGDQNLMARAQKAEADLRVISLIDLLDASIGPIIASLQQRGVITINPTAIPAPYAELLADVVAGENATQFNNQNQLIPLRAAKAEMDLKTISRVGQVDDFVDGFLEDLTARGVAYVPDPDAIPISLFESLARLLALNVAAVFERPRDEVAIRFAENQVRAAISSRPTYEVMRAEYF